MRHPFVFDVTCRRTWYRCILVMEWCCSPSVKGGLHVHREGGRGLVESHHIIYHTQVHRAEQCCGAVLEHTNMADLQNSSRYGIKKRDY